MEEVGHGLLNDAERRFLLALHELGVRYRVVEMSAALLQGARVATEDVDLWLEDLLEAARHPWLGRHRAIATQRQFAAGPTA